MLGAIVTALFVGLALLFYAIAAYHTILILVGLRMTRDGPKPFDKGALRNPVDLPSVSLVIPARDEEVVIEGALRCADRLHYPRDLLEIFLVEDGSQDATPTIGRRMASLLPNVRCLSAGPSKGKPLALNRAMAHARGEVLAVFDSDSRYEPDLLLRMAKYVHDHPDVDVVQAIPRVMHRHTNAITRLNYYETRF
jgi:cellulose synthase/poly-beta-1,6-N-acetylglucosamine synthase-like glycosyltransferase